MILVRWIPGEHLVIGDQPLSTLGEENLVTEFHRFQLLAPLDQIGMKIE